HPKIAPAIFDLPQSRGGEEESKMPIIQHARPRLARTNTPALLQALGRDEFEGYASLFNVADGSGDIVAPGAYARSLRRRCPPRAPRGRACASSPTPPAASRLASGRRSRGTHVASTPAAAWSRTCSAPARSGP